MHFPRIVVYSPINYGGLGFKNLYVESSCNKLQSIMCHINNQTMLGKLFQINFNITQQHTGLSSPILETYQNISYIQKNWYMQIREFLWQTLSSIKIKNIWLPKLKRENDSMIMDKVNELEITVKNKRIFNNWRLYFQATISDVTLPNGSIIQQIFLEKNQLL
jgi:hypothetical protein